MKKEIIVKLSSLEDATSHFNSSILSQELDDYLSQQAVFCKKNTITLIITGISNSEEQMILNNLIHDYYRKKAMLFKKKDQRDDIKRILLLVIGTLLLIVTSILKSFVSEIILVASWVAIWESVYDLFFVNPERKSTYHIYQKLANCKIVYN